ncbi:uncharacterized protein ACO6RY_05862 [Pungitius sinensis]
MFNYHSGRRRRSFICSQSGFNCFLFLIWNLSLLVCPPVTDVNNGSEAVLRVSSKSFGEDRRSLSRRRRPVQVERKRKKKHKTIDKIQRLFALISRDELNRLKRILSG